MKERKLTRAAQADRDRFEVSYRDTGCSCFMSPPCNYCTHPGNPLNQEDDEFYENVVDDIMRITRQMVG